MRRAELSVLICVVLSACTSDEVTPGAGLAETDVHGASEADIEATDGQASAPDLPSDGDVAPVAFCSSAEDGAPCDDGNACTLGDACESGVCVGAESLTCDDEGPCRTGTCDPAVGCIFTDAPDDSSCEIPCFGAATCHAGLCEPDVASQVDCPPPDDPCVEQLLCDPATGECSKGISRPEGSACDLDDNACTLDACGADGHCHSLGQQETCALQQQQNPCWTWTCQKAKGCLQTSFVEGASCNDLNPCTANDLCVDEPGGAMACLGTPLVVDDGNPCTDDKCDGNGVNHVPVDGLPCAPSDPCAASGVCAEGACVTLEAKSCNDGNPCTDDACDPGLGCTHANNAFEQACYTGEAGSLDKGVCQAGTRACEGGKAGPCEGEVLPGDEVCDGLDNDCDGATDEGYPNPDGDGLASCVDPDDDGDGTPDVEDCAPLSPDVHPGADELCNGLDDDCDGEIDEGQKDTDGDGTPDCLDADKDGDGTPDEADCGPVDPAVHPGAAEVCDGVDQDCDGVIDDAGPGTGGAAPVDDDGNPCTTDVCEGGGPKHVPADAIVCTPANLCALGGMCTGGACLPTAMNDCNDGNPCTTDSCEPSTGACTHEPNADTVPCYTGTEGTEGVGLCKPGTRTCKGGALGPCTDQVLPVNEICDGLDNDCDGGADEGFPNLDGDELASCVDPDDDGDGVPDDVDCAPLQASVYPGAPELCNGADDDCDGETDEGYPDQDTDGVADCVDADIDGDGDPNEADCAPVDPAIHHGAQEICDGVDQNCNGVADDGAPDLDDDGVPDCLDDDDDGDGVPDATDVCPDVPDPDQVDSDGDGLGDLCDPVTLGPLATLVVRTAPEGTGQEAGDATLLPGDTLALWAAGYDEAGHFLGDQVVSWTVTGGLDAVPTGPAPSTVFAPESPGTTGTIVALPPANVLGDATGSITVEWPPIGPPSLEQSIIFTDKSELVCDAVSTTEVYVELVDSWGQAVEDEQTVVISTTLGTLLGDAVYLGSGVYAQTLVAPESPGLASVTATVGDEPLLQSAEVLMIEEIDLVAVGLTTIDCANASEVEGKNVVVSGGTVTMNTDGCGPLHLARLEVLAGGLLTTDGCSSGKTVNRLEILASNVLVDATSAIDVSGRGYRPTDTPEGSNPPVGSSCGGSHGGLGTGISVPPAYDSAVSPRLPGAAGSNGASSKGGCGGGVVRITVESGGVTTILGTVAADGLSGTQVQSDDWPSYGSGAGGSIFISSAKILGTGKIHANGGTVSPTNCLGWSKCYAKTHRAAGGGGRIALVDTTYRAGSFVVPALYSAVTARGGLTQESAGSLSTPGWAGAGTVWLADKGTTAGTLIVDNGGNAPTVAVTPLPMPGTGTVLEVTKTKLTEYGKFAPDRHAGWWVNPNVAQGDPTTLSDDSLAYITGNDADNLFFSPVYGVPNHTEVGATYRGILVLSRLEVRGEAKVVVPGDLLVEDGDLHSTPAAQTPFDVTGASLTVNILEVLGASAASVTGNITANAVWCGGACE